MQEQKTVERMSSMFFALLVALCIIRTGCLIKKGNNGLQTRVQSGFQD